MKPMPWTLCIYMYINTYTYRYYRHIHIIYICICIYMYIIKDVCTCILEALRLMDKILHDPKDPKLWELWYIPYYGSCRILSINRTIVTIVLLSEPLRNPYTQTRPQAETPSTQILNPKSTVVLGRPCSVRA